MGEFTSGLTVDNDLMKHAPKSMNLTNMIRSLIEGTVGLADIAEMDAVKMKGYLFDILNNWNLLVVKRFTVGRRGSIYPLMTFEPPD